jgi:hypothetical protein
LSNNIDNARRRRQKGLHEVGDGCLDLFALTTQQFTSALLLEPLKGRDVSAEDKLVDGLDKVLMKLLALLLLLGPVIGRGLCVNAEDVLVIVNQSVDGVGGELVSNLVAQDHVDVDDVSLNMNQLVVHDGLDEGVVVVSLEVGLGGLGKHDGGQGPDGIGV